MEPVQPLSSVASMGPRLFSRGKDSPSARACRYRSCFNGAAAFQPRKVAIDLGEHRDGDALQWGRGFSAAERPAVTRLVVDEHLASMGPRLFSRGKVRGAEGHTHDCTF